MRAPTYCRPPSNQLTLGQLLGCGLYCIVNILFACRHHQPELRSHMYLRCPCIFPLYHAVYRVLDRLVPVNECFHTKVLLSHGYIKPRDRRCISLINTRIPTLYKSIFQLLAHMSEVPHSVRPGERSAMDKDAPPSPSLSWALHRCGKSAHSGCCDIANIYGVW